VITVGAMKDMRTVVRGDDLIASYSSKGPTLLDRIVKPDLVAPGNGIIAALSPNSVITIKYPANVVPQSYYKKGPSSSSQQYFKLNGTSMAAPIVSGAAALLLQKDPSLSPDVVKARLMKTATKNFPVSSVAIDPVTGATYTSQYDLFTVGAGYLDVLAALNNYDTIAAGKTAMSPKVVRNASNGKVMLVDGTSVVWGDSVLWGDSLVWGTSVLLSNSVLWGDSVVWGDSTTTGFSVVWGDSVLWGDSNPFSEGLSMTGDR